MLFFVVCRSRGRRTQTLTAHRCNIFGCKTFTFLLRRHTGRASSHCSVDLGPNLFQTLDLSEDLGNCVLEFLIYNCLPLHFYCFRSILSTSLKSEVKLLLKLLEGIHCLTCMSIYTNQERGLGRLMLKCIQHCGVPTQTCSRV